RGGEGGDRRADGDPGGGARALRDHRQRDRSVRPHAHDRDRVRRRDAQARDRLRRDGSRQRLAARGLARLAGVARGDGRRVRDRGGPARPRRRLAQRPRARSGRALGARPDRRRRPRPAAQGGAAAEGVRDLVDFAFSAEQEELRAAARDFLADHSSPEAVRRAMASDLGFDSEVWKRIGHDLGWTSVHIPEAYGGAGLGYVELVALLEVMGEALLCAPFLSSVCLAANAILAGASETQKREWLPAIAARRTRAALALHESPRRGETSVCQAPARREGGDFVLAGRKRFVLDGHSAELLLVSARRPGSAGDDGVSLFAVPSSARGVERRALPTMDPTRRLAEIELRDVRVPASARLGDEGWGAPALARALDLGAVALAAEQVGGAQRCLDLSVHHAKQRVQFGRPIGSFQ